YDPALLRLARRQAHHLRRRPGRGDRPYAVLAGRDDRRGNQNHDPIPPRPYAQRPLPQRRFRYALFGDVRLEIAAITPDRIIPANGLPSTGSGAEIRPIGTS